MKIAVVGGKLQGIEATYLAHKAGWEVIVLDKNRNSPASELCDQFLSVDILHNSDVLSDICQKVDLVIPAIEDQTVLSLLNQITLRTGCPVAFNSEAYEISSSKKKSDELFAKYHIPFPTYWPNCELPVIIKPSSLSGSQGVKKVYDPFEFEHLLTQKDYNESWIIQEFLEGPSYSLEVMAFNGIPVTFQVTDLAMDAGYDCKRVSAPTVLDDTLEKNFRKMASRLARLLNLKGIMDVEVIEHHGVLKVLEIDARLPSQTPTVVYKSTGINMLESLYDVWVKQQTPIVNVVDPGNEYAVIYEHVWVRDDRIETIGEHIMGGSGPLYLTEDFFGADEALTNYSVGIRQWVATLIITGNTRWEAWQKRCDVIANIMKHCQLNLYLDPFPNN
ncbi:3-methylornithine--L-lysine ligase PylC [Desulfoscipio gibsoniae]|uniref:Pyrrolysine biosynthesis protein PylC n=1 Tax=Desulfoscipio gibsoniae DSM 7213 TaxID=767817 RepID=R4KJ16_9FIRM|nr:3-methylornithine--L-lysine ligase PylC [Desulfoscipio gibsoniae]AGL03213.1 pyrrolysine biosynthesis protein PylC [Desulfoscipio gibsoniae DSM 7213]